MTGIVPHKSDFSSGRFASPENSERAPGFLKVTLILWTLVGLGILWVLFGVSSFNALGRLYLVPWSIALGIVTLAPAAFFALKGRFDPFHPLIYPVWTYFFPGFAIGGLILATGYSQGHYIAYIRDEAYDLPLTFLYLIIGFGGLIAGFAFPLSRRLGEIVGSRLPSWELSDSEAKTGGIVLLVVGAANILLAFLFGVLGFQRPEETSIFGGLIATSTVFWYQAAFILALYIFRSGEPLSKNLFILAILIVSALVNALLIGSRSGLMHYSLPIFAAYFYSGRRIAVKHYLAFGCVLVVAVVLGMIYGTTFRSIREAQQAVSFDRYVASVPETFERIIEQEPAKLLGDSMATLATRIELVSSVAVVVSNYEILAPYEEEMGIANNITIDTLTFFVPRMLWPNKPVSIEPAKYAELYFNFGENAYSMTPIADLLRNFGPIGIPIGMFVLGCLLRILHVSLVGDRRFSYWRLSLYYVLLTSFTYDGTYGGILPTIFRAAVVAAFGYVIVWLVTVRLDRRKLNPAAS